MPVTTFNTTPDLATIQALRSDLALQLARLAKRKGHSQVDTARQWGIPQPTLSKIMNAQVTELSLELLLRIAVRARLLVTLQIGHEPAEAGAFVTGAPLTDRIPRSKLSDEAREALASGPSHLTPEQRLNAHLEHCQWVAELHRAGQQARGTVSTPVRRRAR
jgi:predicted XRE-type DNA-binding protein